MAYSVLTNSGLRQWDYGESGWLTHMNYNVQRLNDTLLKLSALLDVDDSGKSNGDLLQWNVASSKWLIKGPDWPAISTTTTTSTTTSSTTSTTSSTSSSTTTSSTSTTTTAPPVPTEFICAVGPGAADYPLLSQWVTACAADYSVSTTKVFGYSGAGTQIEDGASVIGNDSGATGTCIHRTTTQLAIKSIAGVFQNAERVQKVGDASKYVDLTDDGDDATPVVEGETSGTLLTDQATITGFTSDRIIIRAKSGEEAIMPTSSNQIILYKSVSTASLLTVADDNVEISEWGFYCDSFNWDVEMITITGSNCTVDRCMFEGNNLNSSEAVVINNGSGTGYEITNCACINLDGDSFKVSATGGVVLIANCSSVGHDNGIVQTSNGQVKSINNLFYDAGSSEDFDTTYTWAAGTDYNFSYDATAPGGNSIHGLADGKTPDFVNAANDLHLQATSDAINEGVGPASDSDAPTIDVDEESRSGATCDIGFDEYNA